ncbi:hypothetical protein RUND412_005648 [Rhizina undulata]
MAIKSRKALYELQIEVEYVERIARIVNKLGYGSYSTVWHVKDQRLDRYASLKIVAADSPKETSASEVLLQLGRKRKGGCIPPGNEFVLEVLDEFEIQGPNGTHRCIVTEPLGPSIFTVLDSTEEWPLPLNVTRKVAAQLAQRVAFLHAWHCPWSPTNFETADLHQGNILFCIPGMDLWSEEEVYEHFGKPYLSKIRRRDGQPCAPHALEYSVMPVDSEELIPLCLTASARVKIVDFGVISLDGHARNYNPQHTCRVCRAGGPVSGPLLRGMVFTFGKFPDRWWSRWEKRSEYFAEDGTYTGDKGTLAQNLKARLQYLPKALEPEEVAAFEKTMGAMLRLEPGERVSADEVVRMLPSAWM